MNRVEEILTAAINISVGLNADSAIKAQEQTALEFTKWKDENYSKVLKKYVKKENTIHYGLSMMDIESNFGKTSEQLFNEWNNLNNK